MTAFRPEKGGLWVGVTAASGTLANHLMFKESLEIDKFKQNCSTRTCEVREAAGRGGNARLPGTVCARHPRGRKQAGSLQTMRDAW